MENLTQAEHASNWERPSSFMVNSRARAVNPLTTYCLHTLVQVKCISDEDTERSSGA